MNSNSLAIITGDIYSAREAFEAVAVDRSVNFDREAGYAVQLITAKDYTLKVAMGARQSVVDAVTNVSAIGLTLNPAMALAYLVPRDGRICLDLGYRGIVELAVACGAIQWAQAHLVYEHDDFKRRNDGRPPHHEFKEFSDRGALVAIYVVAKLPGGDYLTEVMTVAEINDIRDRSEGYKAFVAKRIKSTPWASDWDEMGKKTVAKRASKWWRGHGNTERLDRAIALLNNEGGEGFAPVHNTPVPQVLGFDCDALIVEARKQTTEADLTKVYAAAIGAAAKANDRDGAARFKAAALAHRAVLRQRAEHNTIDMERRAA